MLWSAFWLLAGLALIVQGGDLFVTASIRIADLLRMPRMVIGSTLVSLATTSPELVVSIMSGLHQESGLAVGNAVGSCICNIGLILGVMALVKRVEVNPAVLTVPFGAMAGTAVVLLAMTMDLRLSRVQGGILLGIGVAFFVYDFLRHVRQPAPTEIIEAAAVHREVARGHPWLQTPLGVTVQFLLGATLVVLGSRLLVLGAVDVATALGVPSILIGLSVVAVGTSLPELVTAITSSRKNVSDLAVGNILGANVANLTLIIGSAATLSPVSMTRQTQLFNFSALLGLMVMLFFLMRSERRIVRREGAILLAYYGVYLSLLFVLSWLRYA